MTKNCPTIFLKMYKKKQRNEERFDTGILEKEDLDHRSPQFEDLDPKNKKINLCTFYNVPGIYQFSIYKIH